MAEVQVAPDVTDAAVPAPTAEVPEVSEPVASPIPETAAPGDTASTSADITPESIAQEVEVRSDPVPAPAPASEPAENRQAPTSLFSYYLKKANDALFNRKRAKLDKIVAEVRKRGKITNDQVEKLLRVSDATASRYLAQLVQEGRLRRLGETRGVSYEAI